MHTCAVISCDSNTHSEGVNFFRIPTDNEESKGWLQFITEANAGLLPRIKSGRLYVCSNHFRRCCIYPCNPRRNRLIAGHYPSVVDDKVLLNAQSKCALISADENLEVYTPPPYRNTLEKQRAYLVKQLTSFSVQRKIVIGGGNTNTIVKRLADCAEKAVEQSSPTAQSEHSSSPASSPRAVFSDDTMTVSTAKKRKSSQKENITQQLEATPVLVPVKQEALVPAKEPAPPSKRLKTTRPSMETKMTLVLRDNANLKKSVSALEKRVEEMNKEMQQLRKTSTDFEKRYNKLLKGFQRKLEQKKVVAGSSETGAIITKVSNCKCALIEVVDLSKD